MSKVFINYRRGVSQHAARHFASLLASHLDTSLNRLLGRSCVFIDLKSIAGFSDWFAVLRDQVAGSAVMISVIGPGWLDARDQDGNRRLDQEDDVVRFEIKEATSRHIPVLPVLLDGAELPPKDALPADMQGLLTWQAMPLSSAHFERDAKEIAHKLRRYLPLSSGVSPGVAVAAALAGLAIGVVADRYWHPEPLSANGVNQSKVLKEMQEARDVAVNKLDSAERMIEDIKGKLAIANNRVKELEQENSTIVACLSEDAARGKREGDTFRDCRRNGGRVVCGPQMVVIPPGKFLMGSPDSEEGRDMDEGQRREVTIAKPFAVGQFEVSFAEWDACVASGGCKYKPEDEGWGRDDRPVINVSWNDITGEYLPWLSKITGKTYRLLTEAEWEYAARAGTNGAFSFNGKISAEKANYNTNDTYAGSSKGEYRRKTMPVQSFKPNPWGLYQMHGNVWELGQDCKTYYKDTPVDGSAALTADGCPRVVRGGSWSNDPKDLRSANRLGVDSSDRVKDIGFRVARTLIPCEPSEHKLD